MCLTFLICITNKECSFAKLKFSKNWLRSRVSKKDCHVVTMTLEQISTEIVIGNFISMEARQVIVA